MHISKFAKTLIAILLAVILVLVCAVIFLLAKPARPEVPAYQTAAATAPEETAPAQILPAETEALPEAAAATTPAQTLPAPSREITDPDFYAKDAFWPDNTPQQSVERTSDTITVSLFTMEGNEYRRAIIHLTAEGGYDYKETTLFDEKGKPVEFLVTTAEGLTTAMTTWAYEYDDQGRLLRTLCQMTSGETPRTEDRFTYFADGSYEWEHLSYRREQGEEILWNHFVETCNAKGISLSRRTLVENGQSA